VGSTKEQSDGTVSDGDGLCPFPDCKRVIEGDRIKAQAQAGTMGEQLFALVFRRRVETRTKTGKKGRNKWERGFRAPRIEDDNSADITARLNEKIPEWLALDFLPNEDIGDLSNYDRGHRLYGVKRWAEMFSPRQLLAHGISVEVFRNLLAEYEVEERLDDVNRAAFVYLALSIDNMLDYSSRSSTWETSKQAIGHTFARHDFSFKWSYAEMAPLITS
jgi:adenine-specific DNA methylase